MCDGARQTVRHCRQIAPLRVSRRTNWSGATDASSKVILAPVLEISRTVHWPTSAPSTVDSTQSQFRVFAFCSSQIGAHGGPSFLGRAGLSLARKCQRGVVAFVAPAHQADFLAQIRGDAIATTILGVIHRDVGVAQEAVEGLRRL